MHILKNVYEFTETFKKDINISEDYAHRNNNFIAVVEISIANKKRLDEKTSNFTHSNKDINRNVCKEVSSFVLGTKMNLRINNIL